MACSCRCYSSVGEGRRSQARYGSQRGAVQLFQEVSPSIIEVFNGDIYNGTGGGSGSGYVIDREGHFITNKHVADDAPVLQIAFYGDQKYSQEYGNGRSRGVFIAQDPALDCAVGKIDAPPEKFHPVRLGDSALVKPGDTVATFGSPGGSPGLVDRSAIGWEDSWLEFYNLNLGIVAEVSVSTSPGGCTTRPTIRIQKKFIHAPGSEITEPACSTCSDSTPGDQPRKLRRAMS